ncbi:MAG: hypothetical protein AB7Q97_01590 [Gammaproteobacteria bacterium]
MSTSYEKLIDLIDGQWWGIPKAECEALQIEAANDYFQDRMPQVAMLRRRAEDTGVTGVRRFEDIVPLLFSHTTYKSYPMSFVTKGQWPRMTQWLQTLSARPLGDIDHAGIGNIDDWVERLQAAGNTLIVTSGTSGKCSFLNHSPADMAFLDRACRKVTGWPTPIEPDNSRRFYCIGPSKGPQKGTLHQNIYTRLFARPDAIRFLSDDPLLPSGIMRAGALRRAMADGTATPEDIAAFEAEATARAAAMDLAMNDLIDDVLEHRAEPMFIGGMWAQIYKIVEIGRARGIPDGTFSQKTQMASGGGRKSNDIPEDFLEQIFKFFGPVGCTRSYGMSELATATMACEHGRYHRPPWLIVLLLDEAGEVLVNPPSGIAEGRAAFLDMSFSGRWGGIITGDKISMNFDPVCPCGRPGPVVLDGISRFINLGGDDKLGCAGTFDQYMRGMIGA